MDSGMFQQMVKEYGDKQGRGDRIRGEMESLLYYSEGGKRAEVFGDVEAAQGHQRLACELQDVEMELDALARKAAEDRMPENRWIRNPDGVTAMILERRASGRYQLRTEDLLLVMAGEA